MDLAPWLLLESKCWQEIWVPFELPCCALKMLDFEKLHVLPICYFFTQLYLKSYLWYFATVQIIFWVPISLIGYHCSQALSKISYISPSRNNAEPEKIRGRTINATEVFSRSSWWLFAIGLRDTFRKTNVNTSTVQNQILSIVPIPCCRILVNADSVYRQEIWRQEICISYRWSVGGVWIRDSAG